MLVRQVSGEKLAGCLRVPYALSRARAATKAHLASATPVRASTACPYLHITSIRFDRRRNMVAEHRARLRQVPSKRSESRVPLNETIGELKIIGILSTSGTIGLSLADRQKLVKLVGGVCGRQRFGGACRVSRPPSIRSGST